MSAPWSLLEVHLGAQACCLSCEQVGEVLPMLPLDALPGAPAGLLGVLRLPGQLLPVIDPRPRLGLAAAALNVSCRIVVVATSRHRAGLLVDSADDVFEAGPADLCRPGELEPKVPYAMTAVRRPGGVGLLLDLDALLSHDEWRLAEDAVRTSA